ncbi:MAG: hypothetical protein IPP82_11700 [Xanthomonadales bacterium]|nr:hypothetical protein [Xanthomonadales bacterium]
MKRILPIAVCALVLLPLLGGCGMLRAKFGNKGDAYKNSTQSRPLEVPPDLDSPNRSGALVIPEPSASASTATIDSSAPVAVFAPSSAPPLDTQNLAGDGLQIADSLANTWNRVGLALERSGVATIQSRDETARTYDISAVGKKTRSPGFLKKVVTLGMARDKSVSSPVGLRVRVSGSDGASKVSVEGAAGEAGANAARQVLESLRQRMS